MLLFTSHNKLTYVHVAWVKTRVCVLVAAVCLWAGLPVCSRNCTDLFHKVQLCSIFEPIWLEVADKASAVTIQFLNYCLSDVAECSWSWSCSKYAQFTVSAKDEHQFLFFTFSNGVFCSSSSSSECDWPHHCQFWAGIGMIILLSETRQIKLETDLQRNFHFHSSDIDCLLGLVLLSNLSSYCTAKSRV